MLSSSHGYPDPLRRGFWKLDLWADIVAAPAHREEATTALRLTTRSGCATVGRRCRFEVARRNGPSGRSGDCSSEHVGGVSSEAPALREKVELGIRYLSHPLKARMSGVMAEPEESYGAFAVQATGFAGLSLAEAVQPGVVFEV